MKVRKETLNQVRLLYSNTVENGEMMTPEEFAADAMVPLLIMAEPILKAHGSYDSASVLNVIGMLSAGQNPFTVDAIENGGVSPKEWYRALALKFDVPYAQLAPLSVQIKGL